MATQDPLLKEWAARTQKALHETMPLLGAYCVSPSTHDAAGLATHELSVSCLMSSESAMLLVAYERLWDAEVVVRTVWEGSLKFAYICTPAAAARAARAAEFTDVLPAVGRLRWHERAKEALAGDLGHAELRPYSDFILSPKEEASLRQAHPRQQRQRLEQQWSFNGIVRALAADGLAEGQDLLPSLLYAYRASSHLVHKSGEGVSMVSDREQREERRRVPLIRSQAARLCSDVFHLGVLRVHTALRQAALNAQPLQEYLARFAPLVAEWSESYQTWYRVEYGDDP